MNNKIIIGIIVLILLLGIGLIVSNSRGNISTSPSVTAVPQVTESSAPQEQNTITLTSAGFSPQSLTVKAGTSITWINKGGVDAIVNSSPHPSHTDYPPLNLGIFPDGGTLSLNFDKTGTYKYHNHLNPSQTGTIIVQ